MHRLAFVAAPLRSTWRGKRPANQFAHHRVVCTFAPRDGGHQGQCALRWMAIRQITQRAPCAGKIFGCDQKLAMQKPRLIGIGLHRQQKS